VLPRGSIILVRIGVDGHGCSALLSRHPPVSVLRVAGRGVQLVSTSISLADRENRTKAAVRGAPEIGHLTLGSSFPTTFTRDHPMKSP
jgi:hypothetical protein